MVREVKKMAVSRHKKKTKKTDKVERTEEQTSFWENFQSEVGSIVLIAVAVLMWWNIYFPPEGQLGIVLNKVLTMVFGSLAGVFPVILLYMAFSYMLRRYWLQPKSRVGFIVILYMVFLAGANLFLPIDQTVGQVPWQEMLDYAKQGLGGGYVGVLLTGFLWWIFGKTGTFIFLSLVLIVSILGIGRKPLLDRIGFYFTYLFLPKGKKTEKKAEKAKKRDLSGKKKDRRKKKKATGKVELSHVATSKELADAVSPDKLGKTALENRPTLDLLNEPKHLPNEKQRDRSQLVADTLASFGVEATITGYVCGPTLTRYELMPGSGVKVKQIENLADDLALALAAPSVRIEAPIPGKRAVGIEVPNETPGTVYLKEVLNTPSFIQGASPLLLGVGKDISGQSVVADLKKLIHLLIAGSTGSGKSVCINSMLVSLLIKATPEELRLLLIDPKRVELALYEGIPHLLTPVVTDPKEAAKALRWAVMEMEERYLAFEEAKVRDLTGYNEKAKKEGKEILPCIVIVIDELADLMMVASAEVEEAICRLAQKARAAGMHLIVATQRPSTDVVTGLIKANIPSRIAFAVSSGTDSSIILDMRGAEKLLGKGDMLFCPIGLAKPVRLQGAFVSDSEVNAIVDFWKNQGDPDYVDIKVEEETQRLAFEAKDELLPQAARLIVENQRASASFLQRHLRIGYTRAARLIDIMETLGIVGPHQGSKPRDLLVDESELEEILQDY